MKTIANKTLRPIRVPLPRGKVLHLGPHGTGQVSHKDVDHPPFVALVEEGVIEIRGDSTAAVGETAAGAAHAETHGHHPPSGPSVRGNRGG
jgi:hypothetical protein